jgi:hypothetical protein
MFTFMLHVRLHKHENGNGHGRGHISEQFNPISNIMTDFALFSSISDVPTSGSVGYRSSRISYCTHPCELYIVKWRTKQKTLINFKIADCAAKE